jgi:hypothetical protein
MARTLSDNVCMYHLLLHLQRCAACPCDGACWHCMACMLQQHARYGNYCLMYPGCCQAVASGLTGTSSAICVGAWCWRYQVSHSVPCMFESAFLELDASQQRCEGHRDVVTRSVRVTNFAGANSLHYVVEPNACHGIKREFCLSCVSCCDCDSFTPQATCHNDSFPSLGTATRSTLSV